MLICSNRYITISYLSTYDTILFWRSYFLNHILDHVWILKDVYREGQPDAIVSIFLFFFVVLLSSARSFITVGCRINFECHFSSMINAALFFCQMLPGIRYVLHMTSRELLIRLLVYAKQSFRI
jgi:hypothetical protein